MANPQFTEARHSILELAPLELDCMNALWPLQEATVRDIQRALAPTRPRAYTTIMTVMNRLAQKGIVMRSKSGKAWVYRANLSAEEARAHAVARVVQGFFEGSSEALVAHLAMQDGPRLPNGTAEAPGGEPLVRGLQRGPILGKGEAGAPEPGEALSPEPDTRPL
jgi:BlaI family transcriptional regulator, penicillinase repressor